MGVEGKTVCVTGGTGSLGSHIVASLLPLKPKKIIVFSRDEYKQYQMKQCFNQPSIRYFLGNIREPDRLDLAFFDVDYVIHTAALKQHDILSYNYAEAVKTNIEGTTNVVDAARWQNVERVINISSDKAVFPIGLYGATKLVAEQIVESGNVYSGDKTLYTNMRFGNLIGSRGSFIEKLWELRDADCKDVPMVDKRMVRYWISLPDAAQFVVDNIDYTGDVLAPPMYKLSVKDVALRIIPDARFYPTQRSQEEKITEYILHEDDNAFVLSTDISEVPTGYFERPYYATN